jgi:alanine dehydrogenase
MFVAHDEVSKLRDGTLIVDVSCDEGMGFEFAKPTSFSAPSFPVDGGRITYYAVDHSPSHLWHTSTHAISRALIPFLGTVMRGPDAWQDESTIRKAIEIQEGVVLNPKILSFQERDAAYPHAHRAEG